MGFIILLAGLALWWGAHLWKRLAPASRARFGEPGKGIVAVLLLVALGLMVWGYKAAAVVDLWTPPEFLKHLNNLLTLIAVWLFVASRANGWIANRMRHPQLIAVKTWAIAHLLVNGDLASVILFGGLLAWAVVEVILINRSSDWTPSDAGRRWRDGAALLAALILWVAIAYAHTWFGLWPFGGNPPASASELLSR